MKKKTQYTIEMDSQLAAQMWEILIQNFDVEIVRRYHSEDGNNQFIHISVTSAKSEEEQS